jgi:hypothetical protein
LAIIGSSDQWKANRKDMKSKLWELMEDFVGLRSRHVIEDSALQDELASVLVEVQKVNGLLID